jgi:hypothetical protein
MLAELLRGHKEQIETALKIGYATWDALIERVERQGRKEQDDYDDEQIWTFLVCCGYAMAGGSGAAQLGNLLCGQTQSTFSPNSIWFEVLPIPPRKKEGNTHLDLALGNIAPRAGTSSGIRYDENDRGIICFCECKWYSDISKDVSYDKHRNQLIRVIENAITFQSEGHFPTVVHVTLITPRVFHDAPLKSRLYQYKYEEYKSNTAAILHDISGCSLPENSTEEFCYPNIAERIGRLSLNWIVYEDLFANIPRSPISEALLSFHRRFNGSEKERE